MKHLLTEEQLEMQDYFREFALKEVAPLAMEIDEQRRFPRETIDKLQSLGLMSVPYPEELGGQGADNLTYAILVEEIARCCATTAVIISVHTSLACGAILDYGTEFQKEKYLSKLLNGQALGGFALTEADAGTDASGLRTTAVLDGDHYVLNGTKTFITNVGEADIYILFALTDKSQGVKGISAFIVEDGTEGFSIGAIEKKMGIHGSKTGELIMTNCRIPKENLLGEEGMGFKIAMAKLDSGRIGVAAQALGIAQGALDKTVKYVKERKQFGRPIADFQNTKFKLAQMEMEIECARAMVYRAAKYKDLGVNFSKEAAMAKLKASETAMWVTTNCVQLHGGYGYTQEYEVERMMRDAKITEIYEGTSEVMKMVISASLLK